MRDLQSKLIPMFFLQPKSPASFYGGSNLTVVLRQDRAQVIMKIDRGIYHEVVTKIPFPQWRHDIKDFF